MSEQDFYLPGLLDSVFLGDEHSLHQAGFDSAQIASDPPDVIGQDPPVVDLISDTEEQWNREHLPQFGPQFVPFVAQRFTKLEKHVEKLLAKWQYEPVTVVFPATFNTDANGNVNRNITPSAAIYEPPPGFTLALHRLSIKDEAHTFGSPFTVAAGYWELRVNDEFVDGGSLVSGAGQFPVVKTWGTRDALRIRDGEVLSLFISATNSLASTKITVKGQGTLERQPES